MRLLLVLCALAPIAAAAAADPDAFHLELTDCAYVESVDTWPGALLDPLVPADFTVPAAANLVVGISTCTARTPDGRVDTVSFGWADVQVTPKPALRSPEGGLHLYRIEHLTRDDLYGEVHARLGAECRRMDQLEARVSLVDVRAEGIVEGEAAWDIRVPAEAPSPRAATVTHYREFGPAVGGYAYLEGDLLRPAANGLLAGTFTTDAQSPLTDVWGPAHVATIQYGRTFAIADTTIGHLPSASAPAPAATC